MQASGHQFLAGAVGAHYEHPGIRGRHLADHFADMRHRRGLPYHLLTEDFLLQNPGLLHQSGLVRSVLDGDEDSVEVQRLLNEVERPLLDAIDGGGDVAVAGNHYHFGVHAVLLEFLQHLDSVHLRHLYITENNVIMLLLRHFHGGAPVLGRIHGISLIRHYLRQGVADGTFIVNNEYLHLTK